MTSRFLTILRMVSLLIGLGMMAALVGCSSSSHTTPPPPPPAVTVTLSSFPASLFVNDTAPITATVANDSSNAGVSWSCTPASSCGAFSKSSSASGTAVTYTAPATVPSGTVVITATSVASSSATASTSAVTINPASGITVALGGSPASLPTGGTASITATVTGDSSATPMVSWSCAPSGSCGSFGSSSTASGAAVTYTAPASPGAVTITATSVTDDAQNGNASVTITNVVGTTLADGNYVFWVSGKDQRNSTLQPYTYTGVFTVVGGAITTGEQNYVDVGYHAIAEAITNGTITASADGNLIIQLNFTDNTIGGGTNTNPAAQITLNASLVSTTKALLTEYDAWATGSGELDAQTTTLAAPTGAYAFFTSGWDKASLPLSIGGVINVDGALSISGTGSIFDINDAGTPQASQTLTANASTVGAPDAFGNVKFHLQSSCTGCTGGSPDSIDLDGYIVDSSHIMFVENWFNDNFTGYTGGRMLAQTVAQPINSITGTYVIGASGPDTSTLGTLQVAGLLTFNSGGTVSGNLSFNDETNVAPQGGVTLTSGTYTLDPGGTGDVTVSVTGPNNGSTFTFNLQLYLTGDGHATVISMDGTDVLGGLGWQQTTSTLNPASLSGSYSLVLTQVTAGEQDAVGAYVSDGASTLSGYLDVNLLLNGGGVAADNAIAANYAITTTNGDFSVTNNGATFNATAYLVDGTKGVLIENDSTELTLGYFEQQ